MALAATTIWENQAAGSDSLNGGAFDPGQTAGMLTDGAATVANTASPVFTSASYNFVAGDVNAWLYISSGTNWTAGWYKIASVAANAATLSAAIGAGVLKNQLSMTTVVGCATVASPTSATWSIDYSQQTAAAFAYTDLASVGAGLLVSSAAKPFGKQQVGNCLVITGGTNFTTGRYVIASIGALNVATVVGPGNITTGVGAAGTGGLGGALATPGQTAAVVVNGNAIFCKAGTYSFASASTNIATGCISLNNTTPFIGYSTNRTFTNTDTKPIWQTNVSTATTYTNANGTVYNIAFDGNAQTAAKAIGSNSTIIRCTFANFNTASTAATFINCSFTANSAAVCTAIAAIDCEAYANTATTIVLSGTSAVAINCLSYSNTGGSTDGFTIGQNQTILNCTAYANGRDGIRGTPNVAQVVNCHSEQNVANDYNLAAATNGRIYLINSSYFFTGSGAGAAGANLIQIGVLSLSGTAFTNAAGLDFSLNNNSGAGASLRAASYIGTFPHAATTSSLDIGAVQHLCQALVGLGGLLRLIGVGRF